MTPLAALPMYDWPEERSAIDARYARLRARVPELPEALARPADAAALMALWRDPRLLLAQTCWGPLAAGLRDHVQVVAQPDYSDVAGGHGPFYRSAIVTRTGSAVPAPAHPGAALPDTPPPGTAAINATDSLSGALAPAQDFGLPDLARSALLTGSHRASVVAVASGRADWAAIDCRSWALALAHEPAARALSVTGWTAARPGLPFVTARTTAPALCARLRAALIDHGAHAPLDA